jgi:C_GCAxxG_C_C family probable redox protein
MDRKQHIQEYLSNGFNCAQAVAAAFAERVNKDHKTILAATAGFGGGMGRQAMTCGAVTGAITILGFAKGQTIAKDAAAKEASYSAVRDFSNEFTRLNGSLICKELLNCDISTSEGFELHKQGAHKEKCFQCISSSIEILEKML